MAAWCRVAQPPTFWSRRARARSRTRRRRAVRRGRRMARPTPGRRRCPCPWAGRDRVFGLADDLQGLGGRRYRRYAGPTQAARPAVAKSCDDRRHQCWPGHHRRHLSGQQENVSRCRTCCRYGQCPAAREGGGLGGVGVWLIYPAVARRRKIGLVLALRGRFIAVGTAADRPQFDILAHLSKRRQNRRRCPQRWRQRPAAAGPASQANRDVGIALDAELARCGKVQWYQRLASRR